MFDFPPPSKFWLPPKPAIIRSAPDLEMGIVPGIAPALPAPRNQSFWTTLGGLALPAMPKLCLDAGDIKSYPGSGQVFNDTSGNGTNYTLGATSSASTDDPTFNGTAGNLSANEFFSSDGGDFLRVASTDPAWVQNLHKDGALGTFVFWGYLPASGSMGLFGNCNAVFAQVGCAFILSGGSGDRLRWIVCRANASAGIDTNTSGPVFSRSAWQMWSLSLNENGGATGSFFGINNAYTTFNGNVTSPSASSASYASEIMAYGNAGLPAASGSRLGCGAVWEGTALSQAQITAIFNATRRRYGV